jgi:rhodanese-related sulfurtransferase
MPEFWSGTGTGTTADPGKVAVLGWTQRKFTGRAMPTKDAREPFSRITVQEAKEKIDAGKAVMVDVREPDEYVEVHASGVRLIPVNTVMNEVKQIRDLAGTKSEVLFICKSGQRSALAAEFAVAAGLDDKELFNVEGGTVAWANAGLPTGD